MSLETRILAAIERGDTFEVERLRAEYRRGGITRYGGTCEVVSRTAKPSQRRAKRPAETYIVHEVPKLRADVTPSLTVRIGAGALDGILAELERSDGLLRTVETGGNVFGRQSGKTIELLYASGLGSDGKARRFENSVMVSLAEGHQHAKELQRIYQSDIRFIGGWHTHPIREPLPSATDRSEALVALDQLHALGYLGTTSWLDLILIPGRERWDIRGWATRRSDRGSYTEPIRVVD
jgi:hypothetical protein